MEKKTNSLLRKRDFVIEIVEGSIDRNPDVYC